MRKKVCLPRGRKGGKVPHVEEVLAEQGKVPDEWDCHAGENARRAKKKVFAVQKNMPAGGGDIRRPQA